ncbi:DUF883 domain-containing protein [Pseudoalteromonas sp. SSDWG2]|uniref:DUF883 domain-containing protein n=1 Tax=Pseudoalteromonas sp. SSDWG2 TaxID=3139391 RepID=UPI003BA97994
MNNNPEQSQGNNYPSPTTQEAAKVAHEAIDKFAAKAASAEEYVRTQATQSSARATEQKQQLEHDLAESIAKTKGFIKENPLLCAGLAFLAGMIFSSLLSRK